MRSLLTFGHSNVTRSPGWREGVRYDQASKADIFAYTLRKAERDFSPPTMYRDFAMRRDLMHWESQSTLREGAPTAQRYIHHADQGTSVLLFARPTKDDRAFTCLGTATHVEHRNERPIAFVWKLDLRSPGDLRIAGPIRIARRRNRHIAPSVGLNGGSAKLRRPGPRVLSLHH